MLTIKICEPTSERRFRVCAARAPQEDSYETSERFTNAALFASDDYLCPLNFSSVSHWCGRSPGARKTQKISGNA